MKLDNQTIIDAARRLREQDNASLHVAPWPSRRSKAVPVWLVAIPAAAVVGFLLGLFVRQPASDNTQLLAKADTVYVTREVSVPQTPDTVVRYVERPRRPSRPQQVATVVDTMPVTGRTIGQDNIDYALLVVR